MKTEDLLLKGYFTEELPPPFHTVHLSKHYPHLNKLLDSFNKSEKQKSSETLPSTFSTPKIGIHRRILSIPNPINQIELSEIIVKNWSSLQKHWNKSKLSASIPTIKKGEKRAIAQISKFHDFKEKCIMASFDKLYELKADVSKYFPSIYTHSIPWAIHTKKIAKANRSSSTLYGNNLDKAIRNSQSGQTKGIPIGTDTSRIIAESIGCAIDLEIEEYLKKERINFSGHRFIDDYQLYFDTRSDAEKALKILQKILDTYSLDLNEEKTMINAAPYSIDNDWSFLINSCPLRDDDSNVMAHDLITYVNLLIKTARNHPNDYVIKYGIKRIIKIGIDKNNWPLLESLVLKLCVFEPSTLPIICSFLLQNKHIVNIIRLKSFINTILNQSKYKWHSFEVSWTLWIAKLFKIKIPLNLAQNIIDSRDVISIIILLDIKQEKMIINHSKLNLISLTAEFTEENLTSELWLLIYEASFQNWIKSSAVSSSKYFSKMEQLKISFYNKNAITPYGDSNIRIDKVIDSIFNGKSKKTSRKRKSSKSIY